jgi:restriction endonuclease S subunit
MQPNLSIKDLLIMPVPIPPKELQLKIKKTISCNIDLIFKIKELNIKKINECNFLKQSILKQAFNGELVKE